MKKSPDGTKTYYSGSFIYEEKAAVSSLKYILHSEGKYQFSGATGQYQYDIKDHLGNVRLVVDGSGTELQQSAYYPFGMQYMAGGNADNKYLYNGKELQDDAIGGGNLDWYDYGARMYDAELGRFHTQDPMTVFTPGISPYSYADNNPIAYIDYYGLGPFSWIKSLFGKKDPCPLNQHKQKASPKVRRNKQTKPTKNHTRRSNDDDDRDKWIGILSLPPVSIESPEISVPNPNPRLVDIPTRRFPEYKGNPIPLIEDDDIFSFWEDIQFIGDEDSFYDLPAAEKILAELVKTLKEWPDLIIFIVGNTGAEKKEDSYYYGNSKEALGQPAMLNGKITTTGGLMNARARAVYNYLIGKGIDPKRMDYGPGNHVDNPSGRKTSFVLKK